MTITERHAIASLVSHMVPCHDFLKPVRITTYKLFLKTISGPDWTEASYTPQISVLHCYRNPTKIRHSLNLNAK